MTITKTFNPNTNTAILQSEHDRSILELFDELVQTARRDFNISYVDHPDYHAFLELKVDDWFYGRGNVAIVLKPNQEPNKEYERVS